MMFQLDKSENKMNGKTSSILGPEIEIHGDGTEKLDFTYVKDLINGITKVIENPNSKNEIFNLTFGQAREINDLLSILKESFPSISITKKPRDNVSFQVYSLCWNNRLSWKNFSWKN